jgi:hypothetical protein
MNLERPRIVSALTMYPSGGTAGFFSSRGSRAQGIEPTESQKALQGSRGVEEGEAERLPKSPAIIKKSNKQDYPLPEASVFIAPRSAHTDDCARPHKSAPAGIACFP